MIKNEFWYMFASSALMTAGILVLIGWQWVMLEAIVYLGLYTVLRSTDGR